MTGRERLRRLLHPVAQATVYFVFILAIVEFLRREKVVTHAIFTRATIVAAVILWLGLVVVRIVRDIQSN